MARARFVRKEIMDPLFRFLTALTIFLFVAYFVGKEVVS